MVGNSRHTAVVFMNLLLLYCFISGCNELEPDSSGSEEWKPSSFQISSGLSAISQGTTLPLHAYVFVQDVLQKVYNDISVGSDGILQLSDVENSIVYFFGGMTADTGLDELIEGETLLSDFLHMNTPVLVENMEPALFYSGKAEENPTEAIKRKTVSLIPGIARINLKIRNNADIKVTKIILDKVSQQTSLFNSIDEVTSLMDSRTIEFPDGGVGDKEGICHLYEYGSSMTGTVHALYHGVPSVRKVTFPPIRRGFQYTLTLVDIGTTAGWSIGTKPEPWTDGETVDATDSARIYLYPNHADGTISGDTLTITNGSNDGVVSFLAPFEVILQVVEGSEYVSEMAAAGTTQAGSMKLNTYRFRINDIALSPGSPVKSVKVSVQSKEPAAPEAQEFYLKIVPRQTTNSK